MPVEAQEFRDALGHWTSGVTIITALHAGEVRGMTASAFVSVSLSPPLILVSVDKRAHMHALLSDSDAFAVSVLAEDQQHLSNHFAGRPDENLEVPWQDLHGQHVIAGAVVQLACRKYHAYDGGDHTLFIGEVQATQLSDAPPLAYFKGRYRELSQATT